MKARLLSLVIFVGGLLVAIFLGMDYQKDRQLYTHCVEISTAQLLIISLSMDETESPASREDLIKKCLLVCRHLGFSRHNENNKLLYEQLMKDLPLRPKPVVFSRSKQAFAEMGLPY